MSHRALSQIPARPGRMLAAATLIAAVLAPAVAGAATTPPPAADTPAQEAAATASPDAAPNDTEKELSSAEQAALDDGWLRDEEGRYYRTTELPFDARYRWIDEEKTRIRGPYGVPLDVVEYDEDSLVVKYYLAIAPAVPEQPDGIEGVTKKTESVEQQKAEIAKSYHAELGSVDRLEFAPFDQGLPKSGQWRDGFDVADMNGDGELDLVFGPARKGRSRPNIFLGDGSGNWRRWSEASYPQLPYDYGTAAAGDLDGDGDMDFVFGVHLRGLGALAGDGKGGFTSWTEGLPLQNPGEGGDASGFSTRSLELVDWNGDGRLDIFALGEGPKAVVVGAGADQKLADDSRGFRVFVNQPDGTWKMEKPMTGEGNRHFGTDFAFGDFDGDGRRDAVIASGLAGLSSVVAMGREDGTLETVHIEGLRPRSFLRAVKTLDLDGDGRDEILIGYRSAEHGVWRTGIDAFSYRPASSPDDAASWSRRPIWSDETRKGITSLAVGDVDVDGVHDVVALTGNGEVLLLLGDGKGGFLLESSPELVAKEVEEGCEGFSTHLVDLDRDGRPEIVAAFAGEVEGYPGIEGLSYPGCRNQGRISAWKTTPRQN